MIETVVLVGQIIINGLSISSFYIFVALGITLVYGLSGIIVFCQGELLMLGAFLAVTTIELTHNFILGLAVATIGILVLGILLERGIFRFTLKMPVSGFIISMGLIAFFQNLAQAIWSPTPKITAPFFSAIWDIAGLTLTAQTIFTVAIMIMTFAVFFYFLYHQKVGKALRASAEDSEVATMMGIPTYKIVIGVFALGGGLAGLAGGLLVPMFSIDPWVGGLFLLKAFAVALIGGLGNINGTVGVGLAIGMIESIFGSSFLAEWRDAFAMALLVGVLLFRPQGLFRGSEGGRLR